MVHISHTDHPTLRFAARELQLHLNLVSADFRGEVTLKSLETDPLSDRYTVSLSQEGGEITGSNCRSVLLGVYDYLRHLGFRFLTPKDTYIPEAAAFTQHFSQAAPYRHRGVCIEGADSLENVLDMIDWLPKVGFNAFFLQFGEPYFFLERWYTHVNNPTLPAQRLPAEFYQDCYRQIYDALRERSLLIHGAGHGFTAQALGYPSLGWLPGDHAPTLESRALMAQVAGERALWGGVPLNTNLCYGNPEAVERFCRAVVDYARAHPQVHYVHVWLADAMNNICECDRCRDSAPTDQYVALLNRLDDVLTEEKLPCRIVFLLYQELLYPPQTQRLRNPGRFLLMFAPISRTFQESYPQVVSAAPLPPYRRNRMRLPRGLAENIRFLKGWQTCFHGDSFVYDYPLGKAHYGDFGYQHISRIISEDIPRLPSLGLNGYISCQELRSFFPTGLPNYVMGRSLTQGQVDFDAITREYFQAAFGAGWEAALSYLEGISRRCSPDHFVGSGPREDPQVAEKYASLISFARESEERLLSGQEALERNAPNAPMQRRFWQRLLYHREYALALGSAMLALTRGAPEAGEKYDAFLRLVREQEMACQPYLDTYRVQEIGGKYAGFHRDSVSQI